MRSSMAIWTISVNFNKLLLGSLNWRLCKHIEAPKFSTIKGVEERTHHYYNTKVKVQFTLEKKKNALQKPENVGEKCFLNFSIIKNKWKIIKNAWII